ncbi:hypothetical protein YC2023_077744 [Brassica napus]
MGSRGDSGDEEMDTNYSPDDFFYLETQQILARFSAVDEVTDKVTDGGLDGKKQESKRRIISLDDDEDDSDVEITPLTQTK